MIPPVDTQARQLVRQATLTKPSGALGKLEHQSIRLTGMTGPLDLRLGEGTGAVLAFPIIEASMCTLQERVTFDSTDVSKAE